MKDWRSKPNSEGWWWLISKWKDNEWHIIHAFKFGSMFDWAECPDGYTRSTDKIVEKYGFECGNKWCKALIPEVPRGTVCLEL